MLLRAGWPRRNRAAEKERQEAAEDVPKTFACFSMKRLAGQMWCPFFKMILQVDKIVVFMHHSITLEVLLASCDRKKNILTQTHVVLPPGKLFTSLSSSQSIC